MKNTVNGWIKSLDHHAILQQIFNSTELQEMIIDLNTRDQLFEKGEDSLGRRLDSIGGGYAPYTVKIKIETGRPTDRVTLYQDGDFYKSFRVIVPVGADYIEITADPMKGSKDINQEWGGFTIGLQQENIEKVQNYIREKYPQVLRTKLDLA
ncbi:MAG TPA: hypothetical protein VGF79_00835 [Bacteroidia bacterium]